MKKLLSIVIPMYNMEKYIRRCLDSFLIEEELMEKMQVIIVNDGSKDSSLSIANEYQEKHPNTFDVVNKENGNYGSCVNAGIDKAMGEYFRILDADDWFSPKGLRVLLGNLEAKRDIDFVITNFVDIYKNNKTIVRKPHTKVRDDIVYDFDTFDFSKDREILTMHSILYRTSLLKRINLRLQSGISYTDTEYCYFPLVVAKRFIFMDIPLYQYRHGREGQTMQKKQIVKGATSFMKIAKRLLEDYFKLESTGIRATNLTIIVSRPIYYMFLILLVYKRNLSEEDKQNLHYLHSIVKDNNALLGNIRSATFKRIPFFKLWERTGIKLGNLIGV